MTYQSTWITVHVVEVPALGSCMLAELSQLYGLLSPLMGGDRKVVEFHRNKEVGDERELKYEGHRVILLFAVTSFSNKYRVGYQG